MSKFGAKFEQKVTGDDLAIRDYERGMDNYFERVLVVARRLAQKRINEVVAHKIRGMAKLKITKAAKLKRVGLGEEEYTIDVPSGWDGIRYPFDSLDLIDELEGIILKAERIAKMPDPPDVLLQKASQDFDPADVVAQARKRLRGKPGTSFGVVAGSAQDVAETGQSAAVGGAGPTAGRVVNEFRIECDPIGKEPVEAELERLASELTKGKFELFGQTRFEPKDPSFLRFVSSRSPDLRLHDSLTSRLSQAHSSVVVSNYYREESDRFTGVRIASVDNGAIRSIAEECAPELGEGVGGESSKKITDAHQTQCRDRARQLWGDSYWTSSVQADAETCFVFKLYALGT